MNISSIWSHNNFLTHLNKEKIWILIDCFQFYFYGQRYIVLSPYSKETAFSLATQRKWNKHKQHEIYMANVSINVMAPNATYIPPARVGLTLGPWALVLGLWVPTCWYWQPKSLVLGVLGTGH